MTDLLISTTIALTRRATLVCFGLIGSMGSLLMFIADLVLYYPQKPEHRSASSYFSTIDPGGDDLGDSTMREISTGRVMCGGVMGSVASFFYVSGFFGLFFGLPDRSSSGIGGISGTSSSEQESLLSSFLLPFVAFAGHSLFMLIGSSYHAMFAYTCFLSKEMAKQQKEEESPSSKALLLRLLGVHRDYLRFVYRCAAMCGFFGGVAFAWCCALRQTMYSPCCTVFTPCLSAPIKKLLKHHGTGGLVLCGGLTNLWNLCFFVALSWSAATTATT